MPRDFKGEQTELAPPWLRDPQGEVFVRAEGDAKDDLLMRLRVGTLLRFVQYASTDSLAVIGTDRQLPRGVSESDAAYAARLLTAWDIWPWAGTATGILAALAVLGYGNGAVHLLTALGEDYWLDAGGALQKARNTAHALTLDGPGWNHFILLFPSPPAAWGGGTPPDTLSQTANDVRAAVWHWKHPVAVFEKVIIKTSGTLLGYPFTLTLGAGGLTLGGTEVVWAPRDGLVLGIQGMTLGQAALYLGVPSHPDYQR